MRWRVLIACVGLAVLAGGCARDNPLFGLGAGRTGGGSMGDGDAGSDAGIVTDGGGPVVTGSGGGSGGSGSSAGTTGSVVGSTGVDIGSGTTGHPGGTTIGETEDASPSTGGDRKDVVLFRGPDVSGNFCFNAPPADTYGCAVGQCEEHGAAFGTPCGEGAMVFAVLRAEPFLVVDVDAFPRAVMGRTVVGETGDVIAQSSEQLLGGTLETSLQDAGVIDEPFWTGGYDNADGVNADCSDWHSQNASGWAGDPTETNATWFAAQDLDCAEPRPIVCACVE